MRTFVLVLGLVFVGCGGNDSGNGNNNEGDADTDADGDSDADTDTDSDTDADADADTTPNEEPTETIAGDLSDGAIISLDWADDSGIFCWTGNENQNFSGNHVFFQIDKEGFDNIYVEADPESGVDVSLYTLEFSGAYQIPPDVTSTSRCESKFDQANDNNPGDPELVQLLGFPDRLLLVGVAGANGKTSGAFTLNIWKGETGGFDTAR